MSSGVFRQYTNPRLPAPTVTAGQPLDAPILNPAVQPQFRDYVATRLIPLGIAALIPVVAALVPQPALAQVPRATYAPQQPAPELVAPFLTQVGPSVPLPFSPVETVARAPYPIQELPTGIAALIPAVQTYTPPPAIATVARSTPLTIQLPPEMVAPFLTQSAPDVPLALTLATIARAPPATIQPTLGIAPLIPALVQFVPSPVLPRVQVDVRQTQQAVARIVPIAPATFLPKWSLPLAHRSPYQVQLLRAWVVQGGAAPIVPASELDSLRMLHVSMNGRTLVLREIDGTLRTGAGAELLSTEEIEEALQPYPQPRTIH